MEPWARPLSFTHATDDLFPLNHGDLTMRLSRNLMTPLLAAVVMLTFAGCSQAADDAAEDHSGHNHASHAATETPDAGRGHGKVESLPNYVAEPYPMQTCVIAGGKLGSMGKSISLVHRGREVKFCCAACEPKFKMDPDKYLKKIDSAVIAQQSPTYPLDICLISGDPLGDKPIDFVFENRLVRFCCKMCVDSFLKNPIASLEQLNEAAVKAQIKDYPATKCPVAGGDLGLMGKPVDMMVGHRLVRLCCAGCDKQVKADPVGVRNKVYSAPEKPEAE